jgi:hypothetical protein
MKFDSGKECQIYIHAEKKKKKSFSYQTVDENKSI